METEQKCWCIFKNHILRDPSSGGTPAEEKGFTVTHTQDATISLNLAKNETQFKC